MREQGGSTLQMEAAFSALGDRQVLENLGLQLPSSNRNRREQDNRSRAAEIF